MSAGQGPDRERSEGSPGLGKRLKGAASGLLPDLDDRSDYRTKAAAGAALGGAALASGGVVPVVGGSLAATAAVSAGAGAYVGDFAGTAKRVRSGEADVTDRLRLGGAIAGMAVAGATGGISAVGVGNMVGWASAAVGTTGGSKLADAVNRFRDPGGESRTSDSEGETTGQEREREQSQENELARDREPEQGPSAGRDQSSGAVPGTTDLETDDDETPARTPDGEIETEFRQETQEMVWGDDTGVDNDGGGKVVDDDMKDRAEDLVKQRDDTGENLDQSQ